MQRRPEPRKVQEAATRKEARRLTPSSQAEGRKRMGKAMQPHIVNRVMVESSQL
jgi:hypothetical protein